MIYAIILPLYDNILDDDNNKDRSIVRSTITGQLSEGHWQIDSLQLSYRRKVQQGQISIGIRGSLSNGPGYINIISVQIERGNCQ